MSDVYALYRGVASVLLGALLFCGAIVVLGWWLAGVLVAIALVDLAWTARQLPTRWRPW